MRSNLRHSIANVEDDVTLMAASVSREDDGERVMATPSSTTPATGQSSKVGVSQSRRSSCATQDPEESPPSSSSSAMQDNAGTSIQFSCSGKKPRPIALHMPLEKCGCHQTIRSEIEDGLGSGWMSITTSDGVHLENAKPGFGVVLLLEPGQKIHAIRDKLAPSLFTLKTKDSAMHLTVMHVALQITNSERYDARSLPNNLLAIFRSTFLKCAKARIEEIYRLCEKGEVTATVAEDPWIINGQWEPSHLALAVECDLTILGLKGFLHEIVETWFTHAAEYITKQGYATTVSRDDRTGRVSLDGTGWSLYVVFTSEKSYVLHITLGQLKTGNPKYDADMVEMSDNCPDRIDPRFAAMPPSATAGSEVITDNAYRMSRVVERYNKVASEIPNNTLPLSLDAENSAEQHITPHFVRNVWGKYELDRIRPTIKDLLNSGNGEDLYKGGFVVKMAGIRSDVMDFFRLPNFTSAL